MGGAYCVARYFGFLHVRNQEADRSDLDAGMPEHGNVHCPGSLASRGKSVQSARFQVGQILWENFLQLLPVEHVGYPVCRAASWPDGALRLGVVGVRRIGAHDLLCDSAGNSPGLPVLAI